MWGPAGSQNCLVGSPERACRAPRLSETMALRGECGKRSAGGCLHMSGRVAVHLVRVCRCLHGCLFETRQGADHN